MNIYKAYKFRLYPTKEQKNKINMFIGSTRFVYNYYLAKKETSYLNNINLSLEDMKKDLLLLQIDKPWLKEIDSIVLRTSLDNLDTAYKNYFSKRSSHPKYKRKGIKDSYKTTAIRSIYKSNNYCNIEINYKYIKLPKLGLVKIRGYRNIDKFNFKILNATISKESNKYYVSLCVEEETILKEFIPRSIVGIDLGVKDLVITSDGIKYKKISFIKNVERRIKGLQKALSRCQKGSNNRLKIKEKISRAYQKIRNMRKYYIHSITSNLIKENDIIITEGLKVKDMIQEKNISKEISNASLSEIIRQLKYKSSWNNKKFYQTSTYYASSQICNHCGKKNIEIKNLNIRKWECQNCYNSNDRDINASMNILEEGLKQYYKELVI